MILTLLLVGACVGDCTGPACEDAYPASRIVVADQEALAVRENLLQQPDRIDGSLADGGRWSIATLDGRMFVGMPDRREVLVLEPPKGIEATTDLVLTRVTVDEPGFGTAVATADTDADGIVELWVGSPGAEGGRGAVHRFPDVDALSPTSTPDLTVRSQTPADAFGTRVHACEDLTGDGQADLVVTAPSWSPTADWRDAHEGGDPVVPPLAGTVWMWPSEELRATAAETATPWELGVTWWGAAAGDAFGRALTCDDDLTGDGLADLAIGAPFAGPDDEGRVYIRTATEGFESGSPTDEDAWTLAPGPEVAGWFGSALATRTADPAIVTDDTVLIDLVVGAAGFDGGRGRVAVFRDLMPTDNVEQAWFTNPRDEPDHFGRGLAAGDLDGDGLEELLIGAPEWRERRGSGDVRTRYDTGRAWIWEGAGRFRWTTEGFEPPSDYEIRGTQPFLAIGVGAHLVDLDGDGSAELLQPVRAPDPSAN